MSGKKIYIHLGTRRTGSTAIQTFCRNNARLLHDLYGVSFLQEYLNESSYNHNGIFPLDETKKEKIRSALEKTGNGKIVISDDNALFNLSNTPFLQEKIEDMGNFFSQWDTHILCWFRRYDDYSRSAYNQQHKMRFAIPEFKIKPTDATLVSYQDKAQEDIQYFKKQLTAIQLLKGIFKNTHYRIFANNTLLAGNIIDDFFNILNIDIQQMEKIRVNESMPAEVVPYLHAIYHACEGQKAVEQPLASSAYSIFCDGISNNPLSSKTKNIDSLISRLNNIMPGYSSLYAERPCTALFQENIMSPRDELLFTMLFSACADVHVLQKKIDGAASPSLCSGCGLCSACPGGIDIKKIMIAYNNYKSNQNKPFYFFSSIRMLPVYLKLQCVPNCKKCEEICPQKISIRNEIQNIKQMIHKRNSVLQASLRHCFSGTENLRIGIYPSGSYSHEMLKELEMYKEKIDCDFFFFDSNPEAAKKYHFNSAFQRKIYAPEKIAQLSLDRIVIANDSHYKDIYKKISDITNGTIEIKRFTFGDLYRK